MGFIVNNEGQFEIPERILCAAIHYDDGQIHHHQPKNIRRGVVICGRRHHNCFAILTALSPYENKNGLVTQGFLTSSDRYVLRKEAFKIAKEQNQIIGPMDRFSNDDNNQLISEDLY